MNGNFLRDNTKKATVASSHQDCFCLMVGSGTPEAILRSCSFSITPFLSRPQNASSPPKKDKGPDGIVQRGACRPRGTDAANRPAFVWRRLMTMASSPFGLRLHVARTTPLPMIHQKALSTFSTKRNNVSSTSYTT